MRQTGLAAMAAMLLTAAAPPTKGVETLGWMSGAWLQEKDGSWAEEHWSTPRGGVMLGTGLSGREGKASEFEFFRIAMDGGTLTFFASPDGRTAVPFRLVSSSAREAVFENPGHDYPQRIAYRLEGKMLLGTISLQDGSNPMRWRYKRR
jgi:hypothetical protein